ncbi:subtilisin family serine protease [Flavobacterium sp. 28YEA47A]|uniref:S8/S53 family peptidase n=1 Tax=Flavobacterium sp. 28YEA47A TaxID=3156276 RepID=UPI0035146A3B
MKKITLIISFALFSLSASFAQDRKGGFVLEKGSTAHELYVSFEPSLHFEGEPYEAAVLQRIPDFKALQAEYNITLEKGISISDQKLQEMEQKAIELTGKGNSVAKLRNILKVKIDNPTNERLWELAKKLEGFQEVEYCSFSSLEPIQPPFDIPPTTPNFEVNQTYILPNPGVNMTYAWGLNLTGAGIRVRDVEYGFNAEHEDLNERNVLIAPGMTISASASTSYTEHGTAVFGIVYADKGAYGISGMAYGASEIMLAPEWQVSGYNRVNAVTQAIANSAAGDVIIYEMQTTGAQGEYGPAEYSGAIWDLTKAATDAGMVIVAAAGNGAEDLDSAPYQSYRNRGNSGAIIVGAGDTSVNHNRLGFSTFGDRVDVQGWGTGVFATGYGDAQQIGGDFNQYYTNFSGTSSATPIVASCAIVLQSYYHSLTGNYMTSVQMRNLLKQTGLPQGTGAAGNIGQFPDMQAAILHIQQEFLSVEKVSGLEFIAYPNPAQDKLTIKTKNLSAEAKVEISNSIGQFIYKGSIAEENIIDLGSFSQGLYFVKVTDGNKTQTKKIIKK